MMWDTVQRVSYGHGTGASRRHCSHRRCRQSQTRSCSAFSRAFFFTYHLADARFLHSLRWVIHTSGGVSFLHSRLRFTGVPEGVA